MTKKRISIKDIARLTNTSITTVSFVINGKGRISKEIKEKIMAVARENGYEPNRMAVGLRTGVSKVIGLIVESIGGPFFGEMAKIIESEAEKAGYGIIYGSTNNNIQSGKNAIKMLSNQQVDGYIITPMKGLEKEVQKLVANDKPVVLIDGFFPDMEIPHVLVDNYASMYTAINHLASTGYKQIGYVTPDLDLVQLDERLQAYTDVLKSRNHKISQKLILKLPFNAPKEITVQAVKDFIKKNKGMDAIVFATNYLGSIGLQSINELDMNLPTDLAMLTFDDNELFELYPPGISAIQQPTYEIAKSAIDILLSQLNDEKFDISGISLKIPAKLIKRGSTIRQ